MIRLKTLLEVQLIKEALPLDKAREMVSMDRNPQIEQRMDSILAAINNLPGAKSSRRTDRVAVPYQSKSLTVDIDSLSKEYQDFWFNLRDYIRKSDPEWRSGHKDDVDMPNWRTVLAGSIPDEYGRETKISKWITNLVTKVEVQYALAKIQQYVTKDAKGREIVSLPINGNKPLEDVRKQLKDEAVKVVNDFLNKYNKIPEVKLYRENKPKSFYIVFSKHKYDVAGMSTGRGWTSCMNLFTGGNSRYIQYDIAEGTIVAYLVNNDDLNIQQPIARVAIKPFVNAFRSNDVYYQAEQRVYGSAPIGFLEQVNQLIDAAQPNKSGVFSLADTLYCDTNTQITKRNDPEINRKVRDLIQQKRLATTTDEIEYILSTMAHISGKREMEYQESDKLYVDAPLMGVSFDSPAIKYCPIAFNRIDYFYADSYENFENFPKTINRLQLYEMTPAFEQIASRITDKLMCNRCTINGFTGLRPELNMIELSSCTINSLKGIPATVSNLTIDRSNINVTLEQLIDQLKSSNVKTLIIDDLTISKLSSTSSTNKFKTSILNAINKKDPNAITSYAGMDDALNLVIADIIQQIPSLTNVNYNNLEYYQQKG